ncbi:MAG: hypothetical protein ABSD71_15515 [Bacteroidales bacterium]|jgi:hypothetical protein
MPKDKLPSIVTLPLLQSRLSQIFPVQFPDRTILVGDMAARVIFVFLYGNFVENQNRYLSPSHVYLFTEEQSKEMKTNMQ